MDTTEEKLRELTSSDMLHKIDYVIGNCSNQKPWFYFYQIRPVTGSSMNGRYLPKGEPHLLHAMYFEKEELSFSKCIKLKKAFNEMLKISNENIRY